TPPSPTLPGWIWPERSRTCPTPTRPGGSGEWRRRWYRCSGGGERAAAAQDPPAFPLRAASPDPVVDPMDQGVLEAFHPDAALDARPLGDLHADAVGGEELRRRAIPARRITHPIVIHAPISNVGRGLVVPASDRVHRSVTRRTGRGRGSLEALFHGRRGISPERFCVSGGRRGKFGGTRRRGRSTGGAAVSLGGGRSRRPVALGSRP